jgi:hypothetical protein
MVSYAIGASLVSVIATSSGAEAAYVEEGRIAHVLRAFVVAERTHVHVRSTRGGPRPSSRAPSGVQRMLLGIRLLPMEKPPPRRLAIASHQIVV